MACQEYDLFDLKFIFHGVHIEYLFDLLRTSTKRLCEVVSKGFCVLHTAKPWTVWIKWKPWAAMVKQYDFSLSWICITHTNKNLQSCASTLAFGQKLQLRFQRFGKSMIYLY